LIGDRTKRDFAALTGDFAGYLQSSRRPKVNPTRRYLFALTAIALLIVGAGCSDRDPAGLEVARANIDPLVYGDDYSPDVYYQPFFRTHYTAVSQDSVFAFNGFAPDGARSLKFNVPPANSALGIYTGGVLTSSASRDLADFNALTFYARASEDIQVDGIGFGNDNTGTSLYEAGRRGITLTGDWSFVIIPIPAPSKIISERGLLTFAEGLEVPFPDGYDIWLDEIRYAQLDNITEPLPVIPGGGDAKEYFLGATVTIEGTYTGFKIDGVYRQEEFVYHSPAYFDYESSDPDVARVDGDVITVVGVGEASVTGTLEGVAAVGSYNIISFAPPETGAPAPTIPAADVISLFSDVYSDVPVDTWLAEWSKAQFEEYAVAGDNTKMYSTFEYAGIVFESVTVDASAMTHFHLDVYAPEDGGHDFKVKFVSFPPEGAAVQGPELVLNASTIPAFNAGGWSSLEIPLADFEADASFDWGHIGQLVIASTDARLVLVDNLYWHK